MKVSEQVRRAVNRSEMSRYEISKRTGIAQSVLSRFSRGLTGISSDNLDLLCELLKLTLVEGNPGKGDKR